MRGIRNWLRTSSKKQSIPGDSTVLDDFKRFQHDLPAILNKLGLTKENLLFNDLCLVTEEFLTRVTG
ncbi:MAG: hypothetical protein ABI151_14455, partial [Chitinophagaceae bacterium]